MKNLILILISICAPNALATEPVNQREVCDVASLAPTPDDLRFCLASKAPLESMKACLKSTVMFDTFKECVVRAENANLTAEEIAVCGQSTLMRFRFMSCLEAAASAGVEAREIAACNVVARKTKTGISARGRLFIQCAEAAKDEKFTQSEIADCGSQEREFADMRLCLTSALAAPVAPDTGVRMSSEVGR